MRTWKDEKTGIRMCEPDSCDEWLTLLWMVGADYDGCNTVDSLKALVDELVDMSLKAQRCLDEEHAGNTPVTLGEPIRIPPGSIQQVDHNFPPDPFDFVETGEMVEKEPEPKRHTNFDRITKSPEVLADRLLTEFDICPPDMVSADCEERGTCDGCWVRWLNEEATPDD